jgi:hypothetical protein
MLAYEALKPTSLHNKSRGFERQCQRCEFNPRRKNANGVETDKWSISVITPLFRIMEHGEFSRITKAFPYGNWRRIFIESPDPLAPAHDSRRRTIAIATQRKESLSSLPPDSHLITRSALAKTFGGMVNPICLAAFKFAVKINLVGYSTGNSPGFAPFKILSTNLAARRYDSLRSAP